MKKDIAPSVYKSKTLATWIAFALGSFGLHRWYLYGWKDLWAWLHPLPTLVGWYGVQRMLVLGQDDRVAWVLIPILGLMISQSMLMAIIYGLTPDEKWNEKHNPNGPQHQSGWLTVIGVVLSLLVGATVLMASIAFSMQRSVEAQIEAAREISQ